MNRNFVLAIDGTSGSGKTTTAEKVAEHFGWVYLETGATYRAVTYVVLKQGKDPRKESEVTQVLEGLRLDVKCSEKGQRTFVNGEDVTDYLRKDEIDKAVTPVSKMKVVREWLVGVQRKISRNQNVVVEGRDIGTIVFPDADLKIYMDAELEIRAQRRKKQKGNTVSLDEVKKDLKRRDYHDSTRAESPLKKAPDAFFLDTTSLSIEGQVDWVVSKVKQLNESITSI